MNFLINITTRGSTLNTSKNESHADGVVIIKINPVFPNSIDFNYRKELDKYLFETNEFWINEQKVISFRNMKQFFISPQMNVLRVFVVVSFYATLSLPAFAVIWLKLSHDDFLSYLAVLLLLNHNDVL